MKVVIIVGLFAILIALASAGFFMLRKPGSDDLRGRRMARALAFRVALSVGLFLFILFAYWMGWIAPTGLPVGR